MKNSINTRYFIPALLLTLILAFPLSGHAGPHSRSNHCTVYRGIWVKAFNLPIGEAGTYAATTYIDDNVTENFPNDVRTYSIGRVASAGEDKRALSIRIANVRGTSHVSEFFPGAFMGGSYHYNPFLLLQVVENADTEEKVLLEQETSEANKGGDNLLGENEFNLKVYCDWTPAPKL